MRATQTNLTQNTDYQNFLKNEHFKVVFKTGINFPKLETVLLREFILSYNLKL